MKKLSAYIELSRPFTLLSPAIGFISGGVMAWKAAGVHGGLPWRIFAGALGATFLNAFSNSLNQIYDIEIDRVNQPGRPLPSGRLKISDAWGVTVFTLVMALGVSVIVSPFLIIFFAAAAVTTWIYSAPPLRTKARGAWANLTIAVARGLLLFVSGWVVVAPPFAAAPWAAGMVLAIFVFGASSTKDFSDVKGDGAFGIKTLPVRYGPAVAARIIAPFLITPFLLVPIYIAAGALSKATLPLTALSLYGAYIAYILVRDYGGASTSQSRASWIHMYIMLILAQAGFAVCYLLK